MRIALIHGKNVFITGIRRYAEAMEEGLRARGHDVTRVEVERKELRIGKLRVGGFLSFWLARARRAPKGHDIVHALDPSVAILGTDVSTVHDFVIEDYPEWYQQDLASRLDLRVKRLLVRRVPWFSADSEVTRRDAIRYWDLDPSRVVTIHLGLDHSKFRRAERSSTWLAVDRPTLVFVGVNNPRKNILLAVRAVAALRERHGVEARLLRLGPDHFPDVRSEYVAEAKRLGVELVEPGFLLDDEIVSILSHANAFLWPPVAEGFGIPPLEAMACGLPVVALDTPINREICGPVSRYHGPSPEEAADAIATVLKDRPPAEAVIAHARTFSWERMVDETLALYARVLAERGRR